MNISTWNLEQLKSLPRFLVLIFILIFLGLLVSVLPIQKVAKYVIHIGREKPATMCFNGALRYSTVHGRPSTAIRDGNGRGVRCVEHRSPIH